MGVGFGFHSGKPSDALDSFCRAKKQSACYKLSAPNATAVMPLKCYSHIYVHIYILYATRRVQRGISPLTIQSSQRQLCGFGPEDTLDGNLALFSGHFFPHKLPEGI